MRGSPEGSKSDIKTGRQVMKVRLHSREKDRKIGNGGKENRKTERCNGRQARAIERQIMEGR